MGFPSGRRRRNLVADLICLHQGHKIFSMTTEYAFDRNTKELQPVAAGAICTVCGMSLESIRGYTKPLRWKQDEEQSELRRHKLRANVRAEILDCLKEYGLLPEGVEVTQ